MDGASRARQGDGATVYITGRSVEAGAAPLPGTLGERRLAGHEVHGIPGWPRVTERGGPIHRFLARDHARLDELLRRSVADPDVVDMAAYEAFRSGLLRHIAMEEKVLIPEARRLLGGEAPAVAKQLRADHSALAALLVPTPTHAIVRAIQGILEEHNPLEEDPGGLYDLCEGLAGAGADDLLARIQAAPDVPTAAHVDGPRVHEHIANLLRARAARER